MAKYALVEDVTENLLKLVDGDKEFRSGVPPVLTSKPFRWLEYTLVRPVYDTATHVIEGPVDTISATHYTSTFTVRPKTAQEIDDGKDQDAQALMKGRSFRALVKALNDGSFVPGSSYTNPQLKDILKANL